MRLNSVRVRLTLWYVTVLGVILISLGTGLCYAVQHDISASVDRELARGMQRPIDRAEGFLRWERERGGRGDGERAGHGDGGRFRGTPGRDRGPGPGAPPPFGGIAARPGAPGQPGAVQSGGNAPGGANGPGGNGPAGANGPGNPQANAERERQGFFRRPRTLDLNGKSVMTRFFPDDKAWDMAAFQVAKQGQPHYSTIRYEQDRLRILSQPYHGPDGKIAGVIQTAYPLADLDRLMNGLVQRLLTLIPLALLVAFLGGVFLTDRALRPVRKVTQAAAQIGAEDLSRRLEVTSKDEMGELASTFNGMIGRLEDAFRSQAEAYRRMEEAYEHQRRFSADASHELRTPLTRIKASTSLALAKERTPTEYRNALQVADRAADSMTRIVQDLLLLVRSDAGQLGVHSGRVPLEDLTYRAVTSLPDGETAPISVSLAEDDLAVTGDSDHLTRVLVNLLENATRYTPANGQITVSGWAEGESVVLRVEDTGEGIAPEHLPHICDRFYRVDASRTRAQGGTGLGLAICQSIVQAHGGTMKVESEVGRGTAVTISLPKAEAAQAAVAV